MITQSFLKHKITHLRLCHVCPKVTDVVVTEVTDVVVTEVTDVVVSEVTDVMVATAPHPIYATVFYVNTTNVIK